MHGQRSDPYSPYKMPSRSPYKMPDRRSGLCKSTGNPGACKMREQKCEPRKQKCGLRKMSEKRSGGSTMRGYRSGTPYKMHGHRSGPPYKMLEHKNSPYLRHRRSCKASVGAIRPGRK